MDADLSTLSVLAVDDHEINRRFIDAALRPRVASLVLARNGNEAIRRCRQDRFDVVLMDIHMPDIDGVSTWERIRAEQGTGTPRALALTADGRVEEIERMRRAGFSGFLGKPVALEVLLDSLQKIASGSAAFIVSDTRAAAGSALIDPDQARRAAGDDARAIELQRAFVIELDTASEQLEALLAARRHDDAREWLHRLRGAAGFVGALRLQQACLRLERSLTPGASGSSGALLLAWIRTVAATRDALDSRAA